ncbi:transposase [Mammaliicoccus sp. Dog046]|uniref:transposase n=1 Tax=Mammaliicoccus sp. Dog046 TaxID=3034233 RepID=UPI002B25AA11|nr:transposase [Mammaliicoccus sp. Dog046]WQK85563.1 transposase [Mammaliicoccus sp. Dog046]
MSIDMYLENSRKQASDTSNLSKEILSAYESLLAANSKFSSEGDLKGVAYESGKIFFSTIISPLITSMQTLATLTEQACAEFVDRYTAEVDSQSLKESELEEDIRDLESRITHFESMNISLKHKASKNTDAISGNNNMISTLEDQKAELEKKLEKLRRFNQSSPDIFKEVESFKQTVQQGIKQATTSWNPGNKSFSIPSGKQLEWANVANKKYLSLEISKLNKKSQDKKLNKQDLQAVMNYIRTHPKEDLPQDLINYINDNKDSIYRDLSFDIGSNLVEQGGIHTQRIGGYINTFTGIKGPEGPNSFKTVTNNKGSHLIKNGKIIANVGKYGGTTLTGVGYGLGMYDDMANDNKTVGEAVSHNTLTTGGGLASGIVAGYLFTNPAGWATTAIIGIAAGGSLLIDYSYKKNFLKLKDGTDWVGHKIDDGIKSIKNTTKLSWELQKIGYNKLSESLTTKGRVFLTNNYIGAHQLEQKFEKSIDFSTKIVKDKAKDFQKDAEHTFTNAKKSVHSSAKIVKDKTNDIQKDVEHKFTNAKKNLNPMKWRW